MLTILVPPHFLPHLKNFPNASCFSVAAHEVRFLTFSPRLRGQTSHLPLRYGSGIRYCNWQTAFAPYCCLSRARADSLTSKLIVSSLFSRVLRCILLLCDWLAEPWIQPVVIQSAPPLASDLHESHKSPILAYFAERKLVCIPVSLSTPHDRLDTHSCNMWQERCSQGETKL